MGIYYKYGYHNPYFEDKKYGNGAAYHGINSNDYEEWNGNAKSKTDPCPPGYRVPPISVWQGSNEQNATNQHYDPSGFDVVAYRYWNNPAFQLIDQANDIMYPYTGYMIAPEVYKGDDSTKDFKLEDEIEVTGEDQLVPGSESSDNRYNYRDVTRIRTIYSEFIYSVPLDMSFGEMLTQNQNNVFHYEFSTLTKSNIQNKSVFKSAIETKYEIKVTQRKRNYSSRWSDYNEKPRTQLSQMTITSEPSLSTNWRTQAAYDQFGMFSSEKTSVSCNTTASMDSSRGYNIRCIKE